MMTREEFQAAISRLKVALPDDPEDVATVLSLAMAYVSGLSEEGAVDMVQFAFATRRKQQAALIQ